MNRNNDRFLKSKPDCIIEVKAPTDQSIKFLNEIHEKTQENILAVVKVAENNLNGVVVYLTNYRMGYMVDYHIKFNLNGKEYVIHDQIDRGELDQECLRLNGFGSQAVQEIFYKRILELITTEIMKSIDIDKIVKNQI